ncbi:zinc-finger-containing protein [Fimbriiglobus ruber]|uniref:zinc-finger-containing protein n=1 Tax=Fimbriiglobus ruber TaxID=1908690 RepID=UPI000B4C11CC
MSFVLSVLRERGQARPGSGDLCRPVAEPIRQSVLACERYPTCDAYVGCHPGTETPLGRLANKELRAGSSKLTIASIPSGKRS